MVDVEQRSLGPLEQHLIASFESLPDHERRVGDVFDELVGVDHVLLEDRVTIEGELVVDLRQLSVLVLEGDVEFLPEDPWVEEVLDLTGVGGMPGASEDDDTDPRVKRSMDVEVNGKRFEVNLYVPESQLAATGGGAKPRPKRKRGGGSGGAGVAGSGQVAVPMQGTIVKVNVEVGDTVSAGDAVVVLEAMKMENNVAADIDGTITEVKAEAGQSVAAGEVVVVIEPAG